MELQKQMDEARAKKEEQARKKKMEEDKEEARIRKERDELEEQYRKEEEAKKKKVDDVRQANADLMKAREDKVTKKKADDDKDNFVAFVSKDDLHSINDAARGNTPGGPTQFAMPPPPGSQGGGFQQAQAVNVPLQSQFVTAGQQLNLPVNDVPQNQFPPPSFQQEPPAQQPQIDQTKIIKGISEALQQNFKQEIDALKSQIAQQQ